MLSGFLNVKCTSAQPVLCLVRVFSLFAGVTETNAIGQKGQVGMVNLETQECSVVEQHQEVWKSRTRPRVRHWKTC